MNGIACIAPVQIIPLRKSQSVLEKYLLTEYHLKLRMMKWHLSLSIRNTTLQKRPTNVTTTIHIYAICSIVLKTEHSKLAAHRMSTTEYERVQNGVILEIFKLR